MIDSFVITLAWHFQTLFTKMLSLKLIVQYQGTFLHLNTSCHPIPAWDLAYVFMPPLCSDFVLDWCLIEYKSQKCTRIVSYFDWNLRRIEISSDMSFVNIVSTKDKSISYEKQVFICYLSEEINVSYLNWSSGTLYLLF